MSASNTYSGPTTISGGTLQIGTGGSGEGLASATISDGGTLQFNLSDTLTYSGAITGGGSVAKLGPGTLVLTGSNTYGGSMTIAGGLLNFANGAISASNPANNKIYFSSSSTLQWATGNTQDLSANLTGITAGLTVTLDTNGNNVAFANSTSGGAGTLVKVGPGTLTLPGGNFYLNTQGSGIASNMQMTAGAVNVPGYLWIGGNYGASNGTLTVSSGSVMIGSGIIMDRAGSAGDCQSALNLTGGTLNCAGGDSQYTISLEDGKDSGQTNTINQSGGLLLVGGPMDLFRPYSGTGLESSSFNLSGGTLNVSAGTMYTGSYPPSGIPTYASHVAFNFTGGVLKVLAIDGSMPDITQTATSGASLLDVTGNNTTIGVDYTAASAANTATISVSNGYALTMAANTTLTIGAGGAISVSDGTLAGNSTSKLALSSETEALTIGDAGVVSLGEINLTGYTTSNAVRYNGTTTGGTISSNIVMFNSGKTFDVGSGLANFDLTISGNIGDSGNGYGFTKTGSGTLFLSGTNTMTGINNINQGIVEFKSSAAMPLFNYQDQYSIASGAMLAVSVGGTGDWSASDLYTLTNTIQSYAAGTSLGVNTTDGNFSYSGDLSPVLVPLQLDQARPQHARSQRKQHLLRIDLYRRRYAAARQHGRPAQFDRRSLVNRRRPQRQRIQCYVRRTVRQWKPQPGRRERKRGQQLGQHDLLGQPERPRRRTDEGRQRLASPQRNEHLHRIDGGRRRDPRSGDAQRPAKLRHTGRGDPRRRRYARGQRRRRRPVDRGQRQFAVRRGDLPAGSLLGLDTSGGSFTYPTSLAGAYGLMELGGNILLLSGSNTYTGPTSITGGTLQLGNALALQNSTVTLSSVGGILTLNGYTAVLGGLSGDGNLALGSGTLSVGNNSATTTYSGNLSGLGSLVKIGSGELTLAGVNSYIGSTTVSGGILLAKTTSALPGYGVAGSVSASSGATLAVSVGGSNEWTAANVDTLRTYAVLPTGSFLGLDATDGNFTYASNIGGPMGLAKIGGGTVWLTGTNSYGGSTIASGGILQAKTTSALPGYNIAGTVSVDSGATLAVNVGGSGEWQQADVNTLQTSAIFAAGTSLGLDTTDATSTFTYAGSIGGSMGVVKLGTGTLVLSGSTTYTGPTTVSGGTLLLINANTLQNSNVAVSASGSVLFATSIGTFNFGQLSGAGTLALTDTAGQPVLLTVGGGGQSATFNGVVGGDGSFLKAGSGTLVLTGGTGSLVANTFLGTTTVGGGVLAVGSTFNAFVSGGGIPGNLTINSGAAFQYLQQNAVSTSAVVTVNSGGTLNLGGGYGFNNTIGFLAGGGSVINNGTLLLALGSGSQTFTGSLAGAVQVAGINGGGPQVFNPASPIALTALEVGTFGSTTTANLTISGGSISALSGVVLGFGGPGTLNVTAGTLDCTSSSNNSIRFGAMNNSALNISGSGFVATPYVWFGANATSPSVSQINLGDGANYFIGPDGVSVSGVLNTGPFENFFGSSGSLSIEFNGGMLQASAGDIATSMPFMTGLQAATISTGGAFIDTQAYTVTFAQPLLHDATLDGSPDGGLTKLGSGLLVLAGSGSYTGATTIAAGTLQLGNANAAAESTVVVNVAGGLAFGSSISAFNIGGLSGSGALSLAGTSGAVVLSVGSNGQNTVYSGAMSGNGGLVKVGSGTLTLDGNSTYSGVTSINGGEVSLDSLGAVSTGNITFGGGTLQFTSANSTDYSSRIVSSAGPICIDTNGQTVTFASSMGSSNTDGLYVTDTAGGGTLILSATDNDYLGNTEVNAGTLEVLTAGALPCGSGLIVNTNGTVDFGDPSGAGSSVVVKSSFAPAARECGCGGSRTGNARAVGRGLLECGGLPPLLKTAGLSSDDWLVGLRPGRHERYRHQPDDRLDRNGFYCDRF